MLQGYAGDKIKQKVAIASLEEQPFKITDITSTIEDKIKYKLKTIEDGKKYNLEIKTRSRLKEPFRGKVVLKTDNPKKPKLTLFVIGKVQSEINLTANFVSFGVIDTSKEGITPNNLKMEVEVRSTRGNGLSIEKVEPSAGWITTEVENNQKGENYSIIITLDKNRLPKGQFQEKIKIHTKRKKTSEVADVIIEGKII